MIIPGFGMISHIISTFSQKPIFGCYINKRKLNYVTGGPYCSSNSEDSYATYYMRERQNILICTRITLMTIVYFSTIAYPVIINSEQPNPQETNALYYILGLLVEYSMLVGSSETVRMFSTIMTSHEKSDLKIRQWIAGVIDGDGYFGISKLGHVSLEVVMELRDEACLYKLKHRYGGSVKATSHAKALRFRLHHKAGILAVINDLNGLLYNPVRIQQFQKVCALYNVTYLTPSPLEYISAYMSGLFDSDGSINLNITSQQVFITITQKSPELLDIIASVYGGKVYSCNAKNTAYKWTVCRKSEVLSLINDYFHWNGCVSAKNKRFGIVKEFYRLSSVGATKATIDSPSGKSLLQFKERWDSYDNS